MEILPQYLLLEMLAGSAALALAMLALGRAPVQKEGEQKRIAFVDFLKGIAIIGVICVHAASVADWGMPFREAFGFAIPAFILCSGYLLSRRHSGPLDLKRYLRGIFFRIVLLYALFTIALHFFHHGFSDLPSLALDLLLGRADNGSFYFIPLLMQFYLLFPLLQKYRKAALSAVGLALALCFSLYFSYLTWLSQVPAWNSDQLAIAFFGRYAFFFVFGMWLARFDFGKLKARFSLAASGIFLAGASLLSYINREIYLGYLSQMAAIFLLHPVFFGWRGAFGRSRLAALLSDIGKNSLAIYLVHASVVFGLLPHLPFAWEGAQGFALAALLATAISYLLAKLVMRAYGMLLARLQA